MTLDLTPIREIVARATPGDWVATPYASIVGAKLVSPTGHAVGKVYFPLDPDGFPDRADECRANCSLLAIGRNNVLPLAEALLKARVWVEANTAQVRGLSAEAAAPGEAMLAEIDGALRAFIEGASR